VRRALIGFTPLLGAVLSVTASSTDAAVPRRLRRFDGHQRPYRSHRPAEFAFGGRIFVGQKNGQIYSFDASGGSKTLVADLSSEVDD
jgi:hypothetical protein